MTNSSFLIFQNFNHCVKEPIILLSGWFCPLNTIYALNTKLTVALIERNIGVIFSKTDQIIGRCNDTYSFMNRNICILEIITDIQNLVGNSIHIRDRNVDSEGVNMFPKTVEPK